MKFMKDLMQKFVQAWSEVMHSHQVQWEIISFMLAVTILIMQQDLVNEAHRGEVCHLECYTLLCKTQYEEQDPVAPKQ